MSKLMKEVNKKTVFKRCNIGEWNTKWYSASNDATWQHPNVVPLRHI